MSDEFDNIVSGMNPEKDGQGYNNMWEVIEDHYPEIYPGSILVKGVLITEAVDQSGRKVLRYLTGPNTAQWDVLGLLESVKMKLQADEVVMLDDIMYEDGEEDD